MASIIGRLAPEDDYPHPPGADPDFAEGMRFNFSARGCALGGCLQLECRPHQGRAELALTLYLPGGRVLSLLEKPWIAMGEQLAAGGCSIEVIEPGRRLRTYYRGIVFELGGRRPKRRSVEVDLVHEAAGPLYAGTGNGCGAPTGYKQHVRVRGKLRVAGQTFRLVGHGLRDHCWGPTRGHRAANMSGLASVAGAPS